MRPSLAGVTVRHIAAYRVRPGMRVRLVGGQDVTVTAVSFPEPAVVRLGFEGGVAEFFVGRPWFLGEDGQRCHFAEAHGTVVGLPE